MERVPILSTDSGASFFDRFCHGIETATSEVNKITKIANNLGQLSENSKYFEKQSEVISNVGEYYVETAQLYENVEQNPVNIDILESRLMKLREKLISLQENSTLIKKGLTPYIPQYTSMNLSSFESPLPTNRSRQSGKKSSNHSRQPQQQQQSESEQANQHLFQTPLSQAPIPTTLLKETQDCLDSAKPAKAAQQLNLPANFDLARSVKKSARKLTQPPSENNENNPPLQATILNFGSQPQKPACGEMNSILARLNAFAD